MVGGAAKPQGAFVLRPRGVHRAVLAERQVEAAVVPEVFRDAALAVAGG